MWHKIESVQQLEQLHEGSLIVLYPLHGEHRDELDESDATNIVQRLVSVNDKENAQLIMSSLQRKEEQHTIGSARMGSLVLDRGYVPYAQLIEEGVWWVME
ncbi:MAG: hypothetical protein H6551_12530 [Chitinophagales bacterium]|nr:hypothetical protein [Chitinophagaceae bacterium]MCB9065957.1 hypothetical protein [Chitinophagales bacterium]